MSDPITAFTQLVGQAFADRHPEIRELVLERMDAPGDHTILCERTEDNRIAVSVDGIDIAVVDIPKELDAT